MQARTVHRPLPSSTSERTRIAASALTLLLMLAGHTVLETARDTLFLARLSVQQLPATYVAIAITALLAAELNGRLRARLAPGTLLLWTLCGGALGDLLFIVPFRKHLFWAPHAFYVFIAVIATLAVSQFWLMMSELFTVLEAKRVFAAISAGGLLGAMLGGALARALGSYFSDAALIWAGAALLLASGIVASVSPGALAGVTASSAGEEPPPLAAAQSHEAMREPQALRYLRRLLFLGLFTTVAATLVDYLFKVQVAQSVARPELGRFFANFNTALNAGALLLQILLAPRLLSRTGVGPSLTLVPLTLMLLGLSVAIVPGLVSVLLLRASDGGLRYSLLRSSLEVLYLPLPRRVRARWKTLVDLIGQRGGQALASLAILGFIAADLSVRQMALCALLLTAAWFGLALTIEPRYVALFRSRVKAGAIETRAEVPALDLRSLESLIAALGSDDDDEVLAAITLLVDYERANTIPALLLYHPSRAVVLRALEVFANARRSDYIGAARRLLERDDDELRAAAMLALAGQMSREELQAELGKSPHTPVRAAVLVALMARGDAGAEAEVRAGASPSADEDTRIAFARALRLAGGARTPALLPRLLERAGPALELEVARAMARQPTAAYVPDLIQMLDSRQLRNIARTALVEIGQPALDALRAALQDGGLPRRLRAHIPRSISRFGSPAATDLLIDWLDREPDGWVRFKVIRGLGQLRAHMSDPLRMARIAAAVRGTLGQALHYMSLRLDAMRARAREPALDTPGGRLVLAALADKEAYAIDRAVRLIGLRHGGDIIHNIRQALAGNDARLRADSSELLVHRAPPDIALALTTLLSSGDDAWRLAAAAGALSLPLIHRDYVERLREMLTDESEVIRSIAAFHVRELGVPARALPSVAGDGRARPQLGQELVSLANRLLEAPESSMPVRRPS
jgi:AAA family ATP:ADP antiporter